MKETRQREEGGGLNDNEPEPVILDYSDQFLEQQLDQPSPWLAAG